MNDTRGLFASRRITSLRPIVVKTLAYIPKATPKKYQKYAPECSRITAL